MYQLRRQRERKPGRIIPRTACRSEFKLISDPVPITPDRIPFPFPAILPDSTGPPADSSGQLTAGTTAANLPRLPRQLRRRPRIQEEHQLKPAGFPRNRSRPHHRQQLQPRKLPAPSAHAPITQEPDRRNVPRGQCSRIPRPDENSLTVFLHSPVLISFFPGFPSFPWTIFSKENAKEERDERLSPERNAKNIVRGILIYNIIYPRTIFFAGISRKSSRCPVAFLKIKPGTSGELLIIWYYRQEKHETGGIF